MNCTIQFSSQELHIEDSKPISLVELSVLVISFVLNWQKHSHLILFLFHKFRNRSVFRRILGNPGATSRADAIFSGES